MHVLRYTLRLFLMILFSVVLVARFGFTDLLASEISSTYLVELANKDRQKKGVAPLQYNKKLERAAFLKAENMMKLQYWAHYGPNKESPWQFIIQSGYSYAYAGENLAKGFSDSDSVHEAWMASPTHRANILDSQFQDVGIAIVKGNLQGANIFLVVQMFGSPTYTAENSTGNKPQLKITSPKDGDILEDGITDIRGETSDMNDPTVSLYVNKDLLGSVQSQGGSFKLSSPLASAQGEQTIVAKAIAPADVYLTDSVVVTVVNRKDQANGITKETCISSKKTVVDIAVLYTCQRQNVSFSASIGGVRYTNGKNARELSIPLSSLPQGDVPVVLTITFNDNTSTAFATTLSELSGTTEISTVAGTTGNSFILPRITLRDTVFGLFGLTFLLLVLYTLQLAYKRQILFHRYELLSFTLFLGILLITFNFGFVRV